MTSGRILVLLLLAAVPACGANDIGNCSLSAAAGQWCWEGVVRKDCDAEGGDFTTRSCAELGFGCPDVAQWNSPSWCVAQCGDANAHLADCGIDALDCSESAALSRSSCVNACLRVGQCDQLQADPVAVCTAQCTTFVPSGGS
jgi:hypothetical protein